MREHLGLALTAFVFVTLGLRVLAATRGDVSGALALLQNADPVEVFIGMGIQLLPLVPLVVVSIAIYLRGSAARASADERRRAVGFSLIAGGSAVLVASLLVPYNAGVLAGIGAGVVLALIGCAVARNVWPSWLRVRRKENTTREAWAKALRRSQQGAVLFTVVVDLLLALSPTMWLPRESISRVGSGRTVGFVLSSDAVTTVVLTSGTRRVVHIDTSSVRNRRICVLKELERPLIFNVVGGDQPDYPRCPD